MMRLITGWFGTAAWLSVASIGVGVLTLLFLFAVLAGEFGDPMGYVAAGGGLILLGAVSVVIGLSRRRDAEAQPPPEGHVRCHGCGAVTLMADTCPECGASLD